MLNTWGGNGMDSVSDEEYQKVGFDKCTRYCSEYCWHHGMGFCDDCAYDKELRKRRKMESEVLAWMPLPEGYKEEKRSGSE